MRQSRTDVAASTTEKQIMITYINDLLRFCRRVIAYIVWSDRAKGLPDYFAFLLKLSLELHEIIASNRMLSCMSFAPQRWLSTVEAIKALIDKMQ